MILTYQKPLCGKKIGIVFGSFAPLHQGHLDLIMQAKKECDGGCLVISCGYDGDKGEPLMPHYKRYRYVREFFADDNLVAVYAINDTEIGADEYPNGWDKWMEEFTRIWQHAVSGEIVEMDETFGAIRQEPSRIWYVGDENYYTDLRERYNEDAVLVDRTAENPISATMIRNNPIAHWDKISFPFRRIFSTNILICGTASEGKTTLVKDLGKYFNAPYSLEYAREYMKESCVSEWELDGSDYLAFLDGQYQLNKKLINSPANHGVFFADSDSMTTRMYAEYYSKDPALDLTEEEFSEIAVAADAITKKCRWDKIYLLAPHGIFVDDHTRYMACSGEDERSALFNILCDNIKSSGNWGKVTILDGGYWNNFKTIVNDVKGLIENGKNETISEK
ncbi:MAG: AAA family ATPase [Bacteroidales bacterium]|nr:AAA family ATPase [Bacteroidales bacterium]